MTKRIITIILILLILLGLLLGLSWYMARRSAEKNGTPVPTFREFLGIGTNQKPAEILPGEELSSDFTVGVPTPSGTPSQFTNEPMSPSGVGEVIQDPNNTNSGGSNGSVTPPNPGSGPTPAAPICGDADLNIAFTPDEIARLNALQKRFMAVAQNLYTDADAQTELATHDTLRTKYDRIAELYGYCQSKAPLIGSPVQLQHRVPTPFWRANSVVTNTYSTYHTNDPRYTGTVDLSVVPFGVHILERVLRLSLW